MDDTAALVFPREMEPLDYLMFRGEGEPRQRSSIVSLLLLDTNPGLDEVRAAFDRASRTVIRLRQRVVVPALGVGPAHWVVDPDFDLAFHVRRTRVPQPGGRREVLDLAATLMSTPLDMGRPLWEAVLLEDIDVDGAPAALVLKVNHAVTDGVGALELLRHLYDFERSPARPPMPPAPVPEDRSPIALLTSAARHAPRTSTQRAIRRVRGAIGAGLFVSRHPLRTTRRAGGMATSVGRVARPPAASPSPLLRRRGIGRGFETLDVPLDDLRRAAKAAECSVNDAYLAALCGGLRRYHASLGVPVDAMPFAIPVSVRTADDPAGGNRFVGARFAAPVGVVDPVDRMRMIRTDVHRAVAEPARELPNALAPAVRFVPRSLLGALASSAAGTDVQASNVVGYADTPFLAGAKITRTYWFGPLPGVALMIVLLSQAGTCSLGIHYDTASVSDVDLLVGCLREGFDEVIGA